jgi:hypothetical protein
MKMFRNAKGKQAFTIIETDDFIPDLIQDELNAREGIASVDIIQL